MRGTEQLRSDEVCPECGALVATPGSKCWLCGARHRLQTESPPSSPANPAGAQAEHLVAAKGLPTSRDARPRTVQFSLATLLLTVTLVSVLLGALSLLGPDWEPALALCVLAAPAYLHTAVIAVRRRRSGRPMAMWEKVAFFVASATAVFVTLLAMVIAFFATCFGGFWLVSGGDVSNSPKGQMAMKIGLLVGAVGAIIVTILLARLFIGLLRRAARRT